jgi:putative endonuclease
MSTSAGWRSRFGRAAEDHAAACLRQAGLEIVEARVRVGADEIDLVARDGAIWVFVEVKARTGVRYGHPLEAVDRGKRRRLLRAARAYLRERCPGTPAVRFDVVAIVADGRGRLRLSWVQDAFRDGR